MNTPTGYRAMLGSSERVSEFHTWDADRLSEFFRKRGLGEYCHVLKKHKITGRLAPLLSDDDLREMGITVVGDRLMFKHHLRELSRMERSHQRLQPLWEGQERIFFSHWDKCCFTMCGFCPVDPSTYKLTANHLKVKKVQPVRCGPFWLCCFGSSYVTNNIDLSKVDDVDVVGIPAPCCCRVWCCASGKDLVEVESRFESRGHNKITLYLAEGQGEAVATMILNQVEESQKMERS